MMAKKKKNLSVTDLENLLQQRMTQLETLIEKRRNLQDQIAQLDREIHSVNGSGAGPSRVSKSKVVAKPKRKRRRARNSVSLTSVVATVLAKHKKGLPTAEIESAVLATGYKTTSKNFRPMIYQTLAKMKEAKDVVYDGDAKLYKLTK
jgi:cell division septum initiation protein DivIVA